MKSFQVQASSKGAVIWVRGCWLGTGTLVQPKGHRRDLHLSLRQKAMTRAQSVPTTLLVVLVSIVVLHCGGATSSGEDDVDFWDMPDEGIIPDGTGRGYGTLPSGDRYVKGEVWVVFEEGNLAVVDSVWKASHSGSTRTGIASFDSLGTTYHLKCIQASTGPTYVGDPDAFVRRHYLLVFPEETGLTHLMEIVEAYGRLPYVESADLSVIVRALPTDESAVLTKTSGLAKRSFHSGQHPGVGSFTIR